MNVQINQLVKSLLQKDTLDDCSLNELQQFADRHPYFGAAQLLLTKKLKLENAEQYNEQLQKTFLFFHNPLWVEKLLNDTGHAEIIPPEDPVEENPDTENETLSPGTQEPLVIETELPEADEKETEPIVVNDFPLVEKKHIEIPAADEPVVPPIDIQPEKTGTEGEESDPVSPGEVELANTTDPIRNTESLVQEQKTADLLFEPFHTVDYFASQGIKFREEEKPTDKLGQQLKSFTAWLKTMKRLPVTELTKTVEPGGETRVEQMAAHSLQDRDVVTQAMAEVWEKQGNHAKAIEIYSKLSLLEPSKSPYFAAKIEELKKTI